jgi:lipoic acid synthetase
VKALNLRHCVITSVDRDDLPDLGAKAWADTIRAIKSLNPQTTLETLVPDFQGNTALAQAIIEAGPEIISHNMETVRRLTPLIRSAAGYDRSLALLRYFAGQQATVKSGIMLGLGEKHAEVLETMDDLVSAGCSIMTIGQYLQPTRSHYPVMEYVHPDRFAEYKTIGLSKGFRIVESAPLVRSSYHAEKHVR